MVVRALTVALISACGAPASLSTAVHIDPLPPDATTPRPVVRRPSHANVAAEHLSFEEAWSTAGPHTGTGVELTNRELAAPLESGVFVAGCSAPSSMKVNLKVAVLDGKPVGVTVTTDPEDAEVARCIDSQVRGLSWSKSPYMDAVHTTY